MHPLLSSPIGKYDAIVIAVGHKEYRALKPWDIRELSREEPIVFDIKGILENSGEGFYWKL